MIPFEPLNDVLVINLLLIRNEIQMAWIKDKSL